MGSRPTQSDLDAFIADLTSVCQKHNGDLLVARDRTITASVRGDSLFAQGGFDGFSPDGVVTLTPDERIIRDNED